MVLVVGVGAGTIEEKDHYTLGVGIAPVVLFGDAGTRSDLGLGVEGLFERQMGPSWAVRGTTGLFAVEGRPGRLQAGMPQGLDFSTQVFSLDVTPRFRLWSWGKSEEYLFTGIGAAYRSSLADSFRFYAPGKTLRSSGWALTLLGGVGVRWSLSPLWDSEFAVGGRYYTTDAMDNIGEGNHKDLTIHFGVTFLRSVAPITKRKIASNAIRDTDGDGIPDWYDARIYEPEDSDGFQDEDGAPDPDNDGDGIPDVQDKAPNDPETFNGYMDDDGIPDERPISHQDSSITREPAQPSSVATKPAQVGKKKAVWEVYFRNGLDELTRPSTLVLDRIARMIREDAKTRLEIHGYADPTGEAKANLILSRKRAEAVRSYLIRQGASAANLKTIAHGEGKQSHKGKKQSNHRQRRVMIVRIR